MLVHDDHNGLARAIIHSIFSKTSFWSFSALVQNTIHSFRMNNFKSSPTISTTRSSVVCLQQSTDCSLTRTHPCPQLNLEKRANKANVKALHRNHQVAVEARETSERVIGLTLDHGHQNPWPELTELSSGARQVSCQLMTLKLLSSMSLKGRSWPASVSLFFLLSITNVLSVFPTISLFSFFFLYTFVFRT